MSAEPITPSKPSSDLIHAVVQYFKKEGYKVNANNTVLEGFSGVTTKFDLIVQKGHVEQGVGIKEWNRTIGVNVIIKIDKASNDVGLSRPIIIGEKFSDHAKAYAHRKKITLLTKRQMLQTLR